MKKQSISTESEQNGADAFRKGLSSPLLGQWLSIVFGLLFLFQCMILPLVGKAAVYGSGSPGAGPADTLGQNQFFFTVMLMVTLITGSAAFYSKWQRHKIDGSPFPKVTAGLLGLVVALLLAYVAGLLKL